MAGSPFDFVLENGKCITLQPPGAALKRKLERDPWVPSTMLGAARLLLEKAKELAEVADALDAIPEKLPPHMTVDFLYSSLLG